MKLVSIYIVALLHCVSCTNNSSGKIADAVNNNPDIIVTNNEQATIIGDWEQRYTCFDKNGNHKLEPEEKKVSGTHLGFDWFRFNADGSCLRDKDIKFKGTYSIQEKNGTKKLLIEGGDRIKYTIEELTDKELILGADGAFIVFKRIK